MELFRRAVSHVDLPLRRGSDGICSLAGIIPECFLSSIWRGFDRLRKVDAGASECADRFRFAATAPRFREGSGRANARIISDAERRDRLALISALSLNLQFCLMSRTRISIVNALLRSLL